MSRVEDCSDAPWWLGWLSTGIIPSSSRLGEKQEKVRDAKGSKARVCMIRTRLEEDLSVFRVQSISKHTLIPSLTPLVAYI